jgi:hypothetical protein
LISVIKTPEVMRGNAALAETWTTLAFAIPPLVITVPWRASRKTIHRRVDLPWFRAVTGWVREDDVSM